MPFMKRSSSRKARVWRRKDDIVRAVLAIAFGVLLSGCQNHSVLGMNWVKSVINAATSTDVEEELPDNRTAWRQATNGQWDGVTRKHD